MSSITILLLYIIEFFVLSLRISFLYCDIHGTVLLDLVPWQTLYTIFSRHMREYTGTGT